MGIPFSDITLYASTPHKVGTKEYIEETALENFVCELYKTHMNGYKPINVTRVCINSAYYEIWNRTWKDGSLISVASYFNYEEFSKLNKINKMKYILEVVHQTMMKLSFEYNWDKSIFENAYRQILKNNFKFEIESQKKYSRDKKTQAGLLITKTEMITSIFINSIRDGIVTQVKLLDKKNWWTFDSSNKFCKYSKWFDNDKFGIYYKQKNWKVWYSFDAKHVIFEKDGVQSIDNNISEVFTF